MDIINKKDARAAGKKRYFTGKQCAQGHLSERLVSNGHCVVCSNLMTTRWKKESGFDKAFRDKPGRKEKRTASNRRWRHENPDMVKDLRHKVRAKLMHALWKMKYRATKRGLEFSITIDDLVIPDVCPVLGIRLEPRVDVSKDNNPTVDRVDSTKGYVPGNVRVISWRANRLKSDSTLNELKALVAYVEDHENNNKKDDRNDEESTTL